jgi:hypothetical protein
MTSLEFKIVKPGSGVGSESIAAAIANVQTGRRNILGYTGPAGGAGSDFSSFQQGGLVEGDNNNTATITPSSVHWRHNNQDLNLGTLAPTRLTLGAGKNNTTGANNTDGNPSAGGVNDCVYGSLQLPASEQRTTYLNTGNNLVTASGGTAPLAPELPALGMTSNSASMSQLVGMLFGTSAQGNATGTGLVANNFSRDGDANFHVRDGQIAIMELVVDNGPAVNDATIAQSLLNPAGAKALNRLCLTGACGALTLQGNQFQVRYAPQFYANMAGQSAMLDTSATAMHQLPGGTPAPSALFSDSDALSATEAFNAGGALFYPNAMEVMMPRNIDDMPNARRTAKVVFRYRKANSPLLGPEGADGSAYVPTDSPQWKANPGVSDDAASYTTAPANDADAVMRSGETRQHAVGSEPLIEIVAIIPAAVSLNYQPAA